MKHRKNQAFKNPGFRWAQPESIYEDSVKDEFVDSWDREDGDLGNGWIDAHDEHPKWWDQFKLVDGVPVTPDPDTGRIMQPDNSAARAAFYREFGPEYKSNLSASIVWCGIKPYEGTPLIHVNPDDEDFGLGAWYVGDMSVFFIGAVGRRPDRFSIFETIPFHHIDTLQRRIELRSTGREFSVWISKTDIRDPRMIQVGFTHEVPKGLIGSSMHGAALDNNNDFFRQPNKPVILPPFRLRKIQGKFQSQAVVREDS